MPRPAPLSRTKLTEIAKGFLRKIGYAGDIWLVPKEGGTAVRLTSSPGEESFPRFSPDATKVVYSASYDGNVDVFVIPSAAAGAGETHRIFKPPARV